MDKDEIIIEYFDLLQLMKAKNASLADSMKNVCIKEVLIFQGFFNFTCTRRENGNDYITQYHIPKNLEFAPNFVILNNGKKLCLSKREEKISSTKQVGIKNEDNGIRKRKIDRKES